MIDVILDGCGTLHFGGGGISLSLWGIGFGLDTDRFTNGLVGFASDKYTNLLGTLAAEYSTAEQALPPPVPPSTSAPDGNFTFQLQQCISTAQGAFRTGSNYYAGAALELLTADQKVVNAAESMNLFQANGDYPNPSGALRVRLQNLYYTINSRINGNPAAAAPPLPPTLPAPAPSIGGTPPAGVAGTNYVFQPTAADFAGNTATLTFSVTNPPGWAMIHPTTGQLSGVAVAGVYSIVITVTDGCASTSGHFAITITPQP